MIEWIKKWTATWQQKKKDKTVWAADISDGLTLGRDFLRRFRRSHMDPEVLYIVMKVMEKINQDLAAEKLKPKDLVILDRIAQAVGNDEELGRILNDIS